MLNCQTYYRLFIRFAEKNRENRAQKSSKSWGLSKFSTSLCNNSIHSPFPSFSGKTRPPTETRINFSTILKGEIIFSSCIYSSITESDAAPTASAFQKKLTYRPLSGQNHTSFPKQRKASALRNSPLL